jgi:hypothetical protein
MLRAACRGSCLLASRDTLRDRALLLLSWALSPEEPTRVTVLEKAALKGRGTAVRELGKSRPAEPAERVKEEEAAEQEGALLPR